MRIRRGDEREIAHLATSLGELGVQQLELRLQLLRRIVDRPPAVPLRRDATERRRDVAGNDDGGVRLLDRASGRRGTG